MTDFEKVKKIVTELIGNEILYFDNPAEFKISSLLTARIWATCVSPDNRLHAMSNAMEWGEVEESDTKEIEALLKRLELIKSNYIKTVKKKNHG